MQSSDPGDVDRVSGTRSPADDPPVPFRVAIDTGAESVLLLSLAPTPAATANGGFPWDRT